MNKAVWCLPLSMQASLYPLGPDSTSETLFSSNLSLPLILARGLVFPSSFMLRIAITG